MLLASVLYTFLMNDLLSDSQNKKLLGELVQSYSAKKANNSAFSLRAFSKKLGVSSGALTEILKNKRRVTKATARKILENLNLSSAEVENFLNDKKLKKSQRVYQDLNFDQYEALSSWQYLALLNFLELSDEDHDTKNISARLGLSAKRVEEILSRLLRLEMIEQSGERYERTFIRYQTSEDVAHSAIKKYHLQTLELSEQALKETSVELRDFSSIVLKLNPKNLKRAKELIREFQDQLSDLVEQDDPKEIYHMNVHLYPVSSGRGKDV
ncbi:MAG: TIGR02147 family protein [Bacteriovorax sp.]|nr:TIGR02147 family protein [Bacteriovorax sp.]